MIYPSSSRIRRSTTKAPNLPHLPPQGADLCRYWERDDQDEDADTAVEKEDGRAGKGKAKSSSTGDNFVVDPVALQTSKNEWCAKAEAMMDDVSDEDVLDYGIDQSAASDDGSPPSSPPLTFDELSDLFHTDEMRGFLRQLHTPRFAKGQRCPKASSSSTNSANSIFIDQPTSREFVSKAKYLLFKAMQDALLEAEPHLDAAEMVHYHGSLKSSTIALMHYPIYTVKNTQYQSIADTSNPCIRWIDDHFDLDDMLLVDYLPNRMKRRTRKEKVWERMIKSARGHELLREHFKKIWAASEATTGIIRSRERARIYGGGVQVKGRDFFDRILAMMFEEALIGTSLDEDDVPDDVKPHLAYPLPKFDIIKITPLPFGSCTLPVHLIATFDRQGIPLPPYLASIPKPELDILRSTIPQPAKSPMLPVLMHALNRIADPKQQALARNRRIRTWLKLAWDDIVALWDKRPQLFNTFSVVDGVVTSFRNDQIYDPQTCGATSSCVLQLVNDRLVVLREHDYFVRQAPRRGVKKSPVLEAWAQDGALAIGLEAMKILLLQADPKDTSKRSTGKSKFNSTEKYSFNGVSVWRS
ncbi:hypothetical protein LTR27_007977 [Elasticomyces elasticus]|nr:hypothetical protein LTR27_007977 [Elasticomyces elasticus]